MLLGHITLNSLLSLYHNDLEKFPRGIIVYVDCRLKSKQFFFKF